MTPYKTSLFKNPLRNIKHFTLSYLSWYVIFDDIPYLSSDCPDLNQLICRNIVSYSASGFWATVCSVINITNWRIQHVVWLMPCYFPLPPQSVAPGHLRLKPHLLNRHEDYKLIVCEHTQPCWIWTVGLTKPQDTHSHTHTHIHAQMYRLILFFFWEAGEFAQKHQSSSN